MVKMLSKKCEKFVDDYFNTLGKNCVCSRFNDTSDTIQGKGKGTILRRNPSDFVITQDGVTFYAEVKSTNSPIGVSSSLFSQQKARRDRILKAGGTYIYFIYSYALDTWFYTNGEFIQKKAERKFSELPKHDGLTQRWKNY